MLEEENALPGAELQAAISDWNDFAGTREYHAKVRSGIVATFRGMREIIGVLWDEPLEEFVEINPRRAVCVLENHKARARVLDEDRGGPCPDTANTHNTSDTLSDLIGAFSASRDYESFSMRSHRADGFVTVNFLFGLRALNSSSELASILGHRTIVSDKARRRGAMISR